MQYASLSIVPRVFYISIADRVSAQWAFDSVDKCDAIFKVYQHSGEILSLLLALSVTAM